MVLTNRFLAVPFAIAAHPHPPTHSPTIDLRLMGKRGCAIPTLRAASETNHCLNAIPFPLARYSPKPDLGPWRLLAAFLAPPLRLRPVLAHLNCSAAPRRHRRRRPTPQLCAAS